MRLFCFAPVFYAMSAMGQQESRPMKNLDVIQVLARRIATQVSPMVPERSTVSVRINPKDASWYIEAGLYEGLRNEHVDIPGGDSATHLAVFSMRDSYIRYENPRGDNVFGEQLVDRHIGLSLDVRIERQLDETSILVQRFDEEFIDTLAIANIDQVENPLIEASKGTMATGAFFSTFLEPIVLLGSIGVAVFLLFHVRG